MKKLVYSLLSMIMCSTSFAQCDIDVPTYVIDLSNNPDTSWVLFEEDALNREGYCCGASGSDNCIRFEITLNENAAGVFFDYDGAPSYGSLSWQLDCGPEYSLRDTICVTDPGPFTLTFCKPGNDNGNYTLVSVAKPTFPDDQTVPLNCVQPVKVLGVNASSVTWESISPGAPGDYDYLMSCTDCLEPIFTPDPSGPLEVEYRVCGYPILDYCVGDQLFCDTVKFTILDSLKLNVSPINPAFCVGGDVTLTASATGGDGNYNFIWYDNNLNVVGTGANLVVNQAGTYTAEVRDGNYEPGFCDDFFKSVPVVETNPPVVNAGEDQVLCADAPEVFLDATVSFAGGVVWSGGAGLYVPNNTDESITYIPTSSEIGAGSVILTATSSSPGSGCANTDDQIEIFFADTIKSALSDVSLSCSDGVITLDPALTGGIAPYEYSWSNGSSDPTTDFGQGTHCLSVVDANGCTLSECVVISAPDQLLVGMSSTPVSIDGDSDGTATATPSGGTAPYTYEWSNMEATQTITGLAYGIYTVIVTDANGCTQTGSVVVNEPRCSGFYVSTSATNVDCFGNATGTVTAIPVDGTAPYTYLWNDPSNQTDPTATNLPQGVYEVTVMDATGCYGTNTASITEPTAIANTMTQVDVTTQGGSDGSAQANAMGGTGTLDYLWSTTDVSSSINGLSAGWYNVTISDENGCSLMDSIYVNEPPCNTFNLIVGTTSPLCAGDKTADAILTIENGVGPYSIDWSSGESDVMSTAGHGAGLYSVEVTDSRGCYAYQSFGISEPSPLVIGLNATPSTCTGFDNGTIDMSIVGGTFPYYYYDWSTGAETEDMINLAPGSYSVIVTDENGCSASASTSITDPAPLNMSYSVTDVTCFEGTDGAIDVTPSGGTLPYSYDWSNGADTEDLNNIDVGGYILILTDANNCNMGEPFNIPVLEPAIVSAANIDVACPVPGSGEANVTITPTGGDPSDYHISFDGGTTFQPYGTFNMLIATGENHDIIIEDINGCSSLVQEITVNPDLVIDAVDFNKCYLAGQVDEDVSVSIQGGAGNYMISTNNGISYGSVGDMDETLLIDNSYNIVAQDENGCLSMPFAITLPPILEYGIGVTSDFNGQHISCFGGNNGEATANGIGGTAPYEYDWSSGANSSVATGLSAGLYTCTIEDANGCQIEGIVNLSQPALLDITDIAVDCPEPGMSDANVEVSIAGGVADYQVSYDNGITYQPIGVFTSSLAIDQGYPVKVMDANGCLSAMEMVEIDPSVVIDEIDFNKCYFGSQTEEVVNVSASGGTGNFMVSFDNGATFTSLNDLTELIAIDGSYQVVVQDEDGCNSVPMGITLPSIMANQMSVESDYNGEDISCYGLADGSALASTIGGTAPYEYLWNNGHDTEQLDNIGAGTYTVTIEDANGCQIVESITLENPVILSSSMQIVSSYNGEDISCHGMADGMAEANPTGGVAPYSYEWNNSQENQVAAGLSAGTYNVTITDANGCQIGNSITLNEPDTIDLETLVVDVSCNGGNDGSIDATCSGGVMPYAYQWSHGPMDEDVNTLSAGTYGVTITDANGCVYQLNEIVVDPTAIELATSAQPANCFGSADGSIDLTAQGGTPPFLFAWSNGSEDEDINGLATGEYTVTVTDDNGCFTDITTMVNQPDSMELSSIVMDAACFENNDGMIDLSSIGGTAPYTYIWSNGTFDEDNVELIAGSYSVEVIDAHGCSQYGTFEVNEPTFLDGQLTSPLNFHNHNISFYGGNDGVIECEATGGTAPYIYDWSNGETTASIENLSAGSYSVIITDDNGCSRELEISLEEPLDLEMPTAFSPNEDGDNDVFDIHGIEAYPNNKLIITNRWGNVVFEEEGYHNTWAGTNKNGQPLPDGVYFVILEIDGAKITKDNYVHIKRF